MDKVLKLSNKIADAGFEPDLWTDGSLDLFCTDSGALEIGGKYDTSNGGEYGNGTPLNWPLFSADWCWKMLPQEIKLKINMSVMINVSLHEALLELVCWCIDNKYLIPSNKGGLEGKI